VARVDQSDPVSPPLTRVFTSYQAAREAIRALEVAGVDPGSISVLTRSPHDAETLQHDTGASDDLEDAALHRGRLTEVVDWLGRVESAAVPSFGAVLGTGNLWQDIQLAGSGRGSITGALVGCGVPVDEAAQLEQAVFDGYILVVVHGETAVAAASRVLAPS
jgi:hypothetical protein